MTKPIIPEPEVDAERTPAVYGNVARLAAQARRRSTRSHQGTQPNSAEKAEGCSSHDHG